MRKQHGIYVLLVVGIFVLLLVGCGTTPQASGKQNEPGQQAVQEQTEDTMYITLYLSNELDTLTQSEGQEQRNDEENLNAVMVAEIPKDELSAKRVVEAYNQLVIGGAYPSMLEINDVTEKCGLISIRKVLGRCNWKKAQRDCSFIIWPAVFMKI